MEPHETADSLIARLGRKGLFGNGPSNYVTESVVGHGAYGTVYRAIDRRNNNRVVALKEVKIQTSDEGVPLSTLREMTTLKQLDAYEHPNIVRLYDIYPCGSRSGQETRITLVFEFIDQDLAAFLEKVGTKGLSQEIIKVCTMHWGLGVQTSRQTFLVLKLKIKIK